MAVAHTGPLGRRSAEEGRAGCGASLALVVTRETVDALERLVEIPAGDMLLTGTLTVPKQSLGTILLAQDVIHARERAVAGRLHTAGFGTLPLNLLTHAELAADEQTREFHFDVQRLAKRLIAAIDWASESTRDSGARIGLYAAETGATAALLASEARPDSVRAVVSRSGRPDLAGDVLSRLRTPMLFIVGGEDESLVELNRDAAAYTHLCRRFEIVTGADRNFDEPTQIRIVATLTVSWFLEHVAEPRRRSERRTIGRERNARRAPWTHATAGGL